MPNQRLYYFAYGSNMEEGPMRNRCRGAVLFGKAVLDKHEFIVNSDGVATAVPSKNGMVYGIVWDITKACEKKLDMYEDVDIGVYLKYHMKVQELGGGNRKVKMWHNALLYVANNKERGNAPKRYINKILTAAIAHKFPYKYIKKLESWR